MVEPRFPRHNPKQKVIVSLMVTHEMFQTDHYALFHMCRGGIISLKQLSVFVKAKVWDDQGCNWYPSEPGSAYLDALQLWLFPQSFTRSDAM
ncbi:hypothetical protein TNCV_1577921 [Trichonephila clavipes]|nr:hypothetical protein TNCV_1577921 [Trichonephila clavipes]